jgi:hypothetical protein
MSQVLRIATLGAGSDRGVDGERSQGLRRVIAPASAHEALSEAGEKSCPDGRYARTGHTERRQMALSRVSVEKPSAGVAVVPQKREEPPRLRRDQIPHAERTTLYFSERTPPLRLV